MTTAFWDNPGTFVFVMTEVYLTLKIFYVQSHSRMYVFYRVASVAWLLESRHDKPEVYGLNSDRAAYLCLKLFHFGASPGENLTWLGYSSELEQSIGDVCQRIGNAKHCGGVRVEWRGSPIVRALAAWLIECRQGKAEVKGSVPGRNCQIEGLCYTLLA